MSTVSSVANSTARRMIGRTRRPALAATVSEALTGTLARAVTIRRAVPSSFASHRAARCRPRVAHRPARSVRRSCTDLPIDRRRAGRPVRHRALRRPRRPLIDRGRHRERIGSGVALSALQRWRDGAAMPRNTGTMGASVHGKRTVIRFTPARAERRRRGGRRVRRRRMRGSGYAHDRIPIHPTRPGSQHGRRRQGRAVRRGEGIG